MLGASFTELRALAVAAARIEVAVRPEPREAVARHLDVGERAARVLNVKPSGTDPNTMSSPLPSSVP